MDSVRRLSARTIEARLGEARLGGGDVIAMKSRCDRCWYWDDSISRNPAGELVPLEGLVEGTFIGSCRRYPPSIPIPADADDEVNALWPETFNFDWCGEFRPRERPVGSESSSG